MRNSRSEWVRLLGAGLVATLSWGLSSPPALAGIFQCDNDRSATQYPNCTTPVHPPGWTYRSGQRTDVNRDDRLGTSSSPFYEWRFSGIPGNTLSLAAWLANVAFTEPRAEYSVGTDVSNVINQNTAPNGWNPIGGGFFGDNQPRILLRALAPDSARIGADLVQITNTSAIEGTSNAGRIDESTQCGAPAIEDSALVALQRRMLNAVDNFGDVQGSYHIMFANNGQDELIEFEASEQLPGSYVRITSGTGEVSEHAFDGRVLVRLDAARATFRVSGVAPASSLSGPRQFFTAACEPVYVQRQDPAAAHAANEVTLPQNYAFWLSDSDARIVGSASLVGRAATMVEGRHTAYLQDKLGATTFKMWVDDQTGVLLQLIGSDVTGGVVYQVAVQYIQFDRGVDRSHFYLVLPSGFTSITAPAARRD